MNDDVQIRNWEIVMLALHLEGAQSKRVHTEDITLRCFQLAPDAFSWLKHRQYPDKEVVRKDLTRLRDGQYGCQYVRGRAGVVKRQEDGTATTDGWQLTLAGVTWLQANEDRLTSSLGKRPTRANRQEDLKTLERVRRHPLFVRYRRDADAFAPTLGELAELLRCRVDSNETVWTSRFDTLRNQAVGTGQELVVHFLNKCEELRPNLV